MNNLLIDSLSIERGAKGGSYESIIYDVFAVVMMALAVSTNPAWVDLARPLMYFLMRRETPRPCKGLRDNAVGMSKPWIPCSRSVFSTKQT